MNILIGDFLILKLEFKNNEIQNYLFIFIFLFLQSILQDT
jgi:hypothetical protein